MFTIVETAPSPEEKQLAGAQTLFAANNNCMTAWELTCEIKNSKTASKHAIAKAHLQCSSFLLTNKTKPYAKRDARKALDHIKEALEIGIENVKPDIVQECITPLTFLKNELQAIDKLAEIFRRENAVTKENFPTFLKRTAPTHEENAAFILYTGKDSIIDEVETTLTKAENALEKWGKRQKPSISVNEMPFTPPP